MKRFQRAAAVATMMAGLFGASAAHAADPLYYASANLVDENTDPFSPLSGDIVDNTNFVGATFTVSGAHELLSAIGGYFSQYSSGTVFAAIVNADAGTGLPSPGSLAAQALAHTVFDASNGGDFSIALSPLDLGPGTYSVVFGSGLWGATGSAALVGSQDPVGSPTLVQSLKAGASWAKLDDTVRVTVNATPVPEPAAAMLALVGFALVCGVMRCQSASR